MNHQLLTHSNGLDYLEIDSPFCHAKLFLQGAQITEFTPKHKAPLIWVSSEERFTPGVAIRGGIPICWPWFGPHEERDYPQHGFARTAIWTLESVVEDNSGTTVILSLPRTHYPDDFSTLALTVRYQVHFSEQLSISLITENCGESDLRFTQALHSYFPCDIKRMRITGLNGAPYTEFGKEEVQYGDVVVTGEVDRLYYPKEQRQEIDTTLGIIAVERTGSASAIVWNPWHDKSITLSNFGNDDYLSMICLESANAGSDAIMLKPKQNHTLNTTISWR